MITNLAIKYHEKTKEMQRLLSEWKNQVDAQESISNPNCDPEKKDKWKLNY